ncbi:MAG TPA: hypothetical protein VIE64_03290 [Solirubrobacterales bacterium]
MGNRLLLALSALAVLALSSASTASATNCTPPYCPSFTVTVKKVGSGSGNVVSSPAGIDCGPQCSASFEEQSTVVLSASAAPGSTFVGWFGGGCSGTGNCVLKIPRYNVKVTAAFNVKKKPPPPNNFQLGKVKHPSTGVVTIRVKVPAPGTFTATAPRMKTIKAQVKTPGQFTLPLRLSSKGLADLKASQGGQLRIKVKFTFSPTGGEPRTKLKKIIFRVVK